MVYGHTEGNTPGFSSAFYSDENEVLVLGNDGMTGAVEKPFKIVSTATDAGNSPTTTLRGGLVMIEDASTGKVQPYADSVEGRIVGILPKAQNMIGMNGVVEDRWVNLLVAGNINSNRIHNGTKALFKRLAAVGFWFDDPAVQVAASFDGYTASVLGAGTVVLTADDHGRQFVSVDADDVNITLPTTLQEGLSYEFKTWTTDAVATDMVITAAAGSVLNTGAVEAQTISLLAGGEHIRITAVDIDGANTFRWEVQSFGIAAPALS